MNWSWKKSAWKATKKILIVAGSAAVTAVGTSLSDPAVVGKILAEAAVPVTVAGTATGVITWLATFALDWKKHSWDKK